MKPFWVKSPANQKTFQSRSASSDYGFSIRACTIYVDLFLTVLLHSNRLPASTPSPTDKLIYQILNSDIPTPSHNSSEMLKEQLAEHSSTLAYQ